MHFQLGTTKHEIFMEETLKVAKQEHYVNYFC